MGIFDIFSKRQRRLRGDVPDVYVYDALPNPLRVQIIQIWRETLGVLVIHHHPWGDTSSNSDVENAYKSIVRALRKEYGVFRLPGLEDQHGEVSVYEELQLFFLREKDVNWALDAVELSFRLIDSVTRDWGYLQRDDAPQRADAAIEELNHRFQEHGVGYQFTNGQIIRIDSELIHSEIVKPALTLLHELHYTGAQEEFLKAHKHYREGNQKEALSNCLNAFESVMKTICDKRGWSYNQNATANSLIDICLGNGLIDAFWQSHYDSLKSLLKSSVPTGRNRLGGHGQGTTPVSVPNHLVAYMLHMTASAIVFLAEAEKQLR